MKYAWIENNQIKDIAWANPSEIYHPDVAKFYTTQVPDTAVNGDGWVNGAIVKPARQWNEFDFRAGMTLAEKTKWDSDAIPEIKTVKTELPKERAEVSELLDFLVSVNVISQKTAEKILV
jgi:hypothetical protein